jgi:hypothetical protein
MKREQGIDKKYYALIFSPTYNRELVENYRPKKKREEI